MTSSDPAPSFALAPQEVLPSPAHKIASDDVCNVVFQCSWAWGTIVLLLHDAHSQGSTSSRSQALALSAYSTV